MMSLVVLAKFLLSAVFVTAGVSKLAGPAASRKTLRDFGVPAWLSNPFAILLPVVELGAGVGLLLARFSWYASGAALALLATFVLVIVVSLIRGRRPDCHCFGRLHSKPIGWDLVARNLVLGLVAGLVIYTGPHQPGVVDWINGAIAAHRFLFVLGLAGVALTAGHCWFTFQLARQSGRLLARLDEMEKRVAVPGPGQLAMMPASAVQVQAEAAGLRIGEKAPSFALKNLSERITSLEDLLAASKPVILLFVHPDCGPCKALLSKAAEWQEEIAAHCTLVLISQGSRKQNLAKAAGRAFQHFLIQDKQEVSEAYWGNATPSAVVIRSDGTIGSPVASGAEQIQTLAADLINEPVAAPVMTAVKEGDPVPRLVYPDLDGRLVSLAGAHGRARVILFWNPSCGFCRQMVAEVNKWHDAFRAPHPSFVVISTGSGEDNRNLGLKPRLLLDPRFSAGEAFAARSTPSAILIDEHGRIDSKLAIGRDEITRLVSNAALASEASGAASEFRFDRKPPIDIVPEKWINAFTGARQNTPI
jgi:peroxiredoxin/uncharacterized membrane protein YphA (DoxX/SURF4 family)